MGGAMAGGDGARVPMRPARLPELDGLRGWASFWVVVFHLGWETFGMVCPAFRNPLTAAFNGGLAVTVFFVLSGEALSSGFFAGRGSSQVAALAVKRLPRLAIPIFFALLLTVLVARAGLTVHLAEAARITARPYWLGTMRPDEIPLSALIRFPLIDAYTSSEPDGAINPFLWTMNIEMLGSMLVFVALLCWDHLRCPAWIVAGLGGVLLLNYPATYLSGFCFGMLIARWRHAGGAERLAARPATSWIAGVAIVGLLALSAASMTAQAYGLPPRIHARLCCLLAPLLVVACSLCGPVRAFLSGRLSQMLGTLSFPLYLVQYPVIVSVTAFLIVRMRGRAGVTDADAALIVVLSLLACLAAARAFLPVEWLTKWVGKQIETAVVSGKTGRTAPR